MCPRNQRLAELTTCQRTRLDGIAISAYYTKAGSVGILCAISLMLSLLAGRWTFQRVTGAEEAVGFVASFPIRNVFLAILLLFLPAVLLRRPSTKASMESLILLSASIGLYGLLFLRALISGTYEESGLIYELVFVVIVTVVAFLVARRIHSLSIIVMGILASWALLMAVLALAQGALSGFDTRTGVLGGGPNVLARIEGLGIMATMALAIYGPRRVLFLAVPPMFATMVLTGSRGALLSLVILAVPWVAYALFRHRRWFYATAAVCGLAVTGLVAWPRANEFVAERYIDLTLRQGYLSPRPQLYNLAWESFLERPLVGHGPGWFESQFSLYPHNLTLQTMSESGLLGLVLLLVAIVALLVLLVRCRNWPGRTMVLMALFVLIHAQFSGDWFDGRLIWVLGAMAGASSLRDVQPAIRHFPERTNRLQQPCPLSVSSEVGQRRLGPELKHQG